MWLKVGDGGETAPLHAVNRNLKKWLLCTCFLIFKRLRRAAPSEKNVQLQIIIHVN